MDKKTEIISGLTNEQLEKIVQETLARQEIEIDGHEFLETLMLLDEGCRAYENAFTDKYFGFIKPDGSVLSNWRFDIRVLRALLATPFLHLTEHWQGNLDNPIQLLLYSLTEEGEIFWNQWGKSAPHRGEIFWTILEKKDTKTVVYPFIGSHPPQAEHVFQIYGKTVEANSITISGPHEIRWLQPEAFGREKFS